MLKEINGYWQDETCNTWSTKDYTKANAEAAAASLTDCCFCRNCANCTDCENCTECTDCKESTLCTTAAPAVPQYTTGSLAA